MPHRKKKKISPKKENKPKQHAYYVCDGGTCTCDGAAAPTAPVPIKVTSHKKYYILGGQKLIATDKDNTNQTWILSLVKMYRLTVRRNLVRQN